MGCRPVELHGPANAIHNERCHGGGYHRASVSCQFWATDGSFSLIYGCMSPIAGMVGDRMNRKWLIVGSLFVWSAVTYLMGIADTYNEVFFLRALMGISEALYIPAGLSLIADYHSDKSRSLAIGIHMTGLYTGQAIGGFGATVAAAFSWHTTFHWFGIAGIAYAVILMLFLHEKKDRIQIEQINSPSGKEKAIY